MYSSNYHSHSTFCDGRSSMEDFVGFAIAANLRKFGFSSHAPLPFHTSWSMNIDDFGDYQSEFTRLKQKYSHQIELFFGLEADYIDGCTDACNEFYKRHQFDYLISSVHYLDQTGNGVYWSIDGPFDAFVKGLNQLHNGDIYAAVNRFFDVSNQMIDKGGFDIVGHIDKIIMHGFRYPEFSINCPEYIGLMHRTLENIARKGLMLEINTKSLKESGYTFPHRNFYSVIRELQIPLVLSSDCHYPYKITEGFAETISELKKAGINELYELSGREWTAVNI